MGGVYSSLSAYRVLFLALGRPDPWAPRSSGRHQPLQRSSTSSGSHFVSVAGLWQEDILAMAYRTPPATFFAVWSLRKLITSFGLACSVSRFGPQPLVSLVWLTYSPMAVAYSGSGGLRRGNRFQNQRNAALTRLCYWWVGSYGRKETPGRLMVAKRHGKFALRLSAAGGEPLGLGRIPLSSGTPTVGAS